jgi:hypothetical protein
MSQSVPSAPEAFTDRRHRELGAPGVERRQFVDSRSDLSPDARQLADAIDQYKLRHRRRFLTYEEMVSLIQSLGYRKG